MEKDKRIKVLLAAPVPPPYGGIGNWVLLMRQYLAGSEDVQLLDVLNTGPKQRGLDGRSLWDRVVGQGLEMLKSKRALKSKIRREAPDVIHITTSGQLAIIRDIFFLKTAKKEGVPSVYHIRFGRIPEIAQSNTLEWKLMKKAISLASKTMTIDEKTYSALKDQFEAGRICKVPNPFDVSTLKALARNVQPIEPHKIMFLGWCVKTKGIEELLSAWDSVCGDYTNWILEIVGPAEETYLDFLKKRYSMQQVRMLGEKKHDEAMELLNEADVFILPSYTEGFPNAVLEAMALEKPIVATDVGAIGEMLANGCGVLIKPQNTEEVINALKLLMSNEQLRMELGKNARRHLEEEYTIDAVLEQYKSIWSEVSV